MREALVESAGNSEQKQQLTIKTGNSTLTRGFVERKHMNYVQLSKLVIAAGIRSKMVP